jgi:hypothetical protein
MYSQQTGMEDQVYAPTEEVGWQRKAKTSSAADLISNAIGSNVLGCQLMSTTLSQVKILCRQVNQVAHLKGCIPSPFVGMKCLFDALCEYGIMRTYQSFMQFLHKFLHTRQDVQRWTPEQGG